jgi:hypothetical protein
MDHLDEAMFVENIDLGRRINGHNPWLRMTLELASLQSVLVLRKSIL